MSRKPYILAAVVLFYTVALAGEPVDIRVPIPSRRDIRAIQTPADLDASDYEALRPDSAGIRYYYDRFNQSRKENGRSLTRVDMYFITLLPLDYRGADSFATKVLGPEEGLKTVDGVMATIPNLMSFFESLSAGKIEQAIENIGPYQDVTINFTLDDKAIARRYPGLVGRINNHIRNLTVDLRNRDGDLLFGFRYADNRAAINFILDPRGYFVAMDADGRPIPSPVKKLSLQDAREGVRLYIDIGFDSSATLLKILRLFRVEVERIRVRVDIKQDDRRLGIAWETIDVAPGKIAVTGLNSDPIRDNLLHMKGTLKGTIEFWPAQTTGERLTFIRVFGTGEQIDHWLVELALLTWEQIGDQVLSDMSIPIADVLLAAQRDVMRQDGEE